MNFSPMLRIAPPPFGGDIEGTPPKLTALPAAFPLAGACGSDCIENGRCTGCFILRGILWGTTGSVKHVKHEKRAPISRLAQPPFSPCPGLMVLKALRGQDDKEQILFESVLALEGQGQLAVAVTQGHKGYQVRLVSNLPGALTLHWGIACRSPSEWLRPPASLHPPGTTLFEGHTAHTPFTFRDGFYRLGLDFLEAEAPLGIRFVLRQTDSGRWLNDHGKCFYVPVGQPQATIDDGGAANPMLHPGGRNK